MTPLILASTSVYRKKLLQRLRVPFTTEAPDVDETIFQSLGLPPQELAETLALKKAKAVSLKHPEATVIGSDQVVCLDGKIFGKPLTKQRAIEQLTLLNGKTHELITAVAVVGKFERIVTETTRLTLAHHEPAAILRYVEADQPLDCAGSYKIESLGISLFESIECTDQSAIEGLPLLHLTRVLREFGWVIP